MLAVPLLLAVVVAGNAQKLDLTAELRALVDSERAFARAVAARGIRDGFLAYMAEDAVLFRPGPVMARQYLPEQPASKAHLSWFPTFADVARSGDLGYTTGPWELRPDGARGAVRGHGQFVTVWRKQADGSWKVVLDDGTQHPAPRTAARLFRPAAGRGTQVLRPAADPDSERVVLLEVERAFAAAAESVGTARAYERFAAAELRLLRNGRMPVLGLPAARGPLAARRGTLTWNPQRVEVSRAGDLAYAYGDYRYVERASARGAVPESGHYTRLWKRQPSGAWRAVLDVAVPAPPSEGRR